MKNDLTILLIEDDEMTLDIFRRILSKEYNFLFTSDVNKFYLLSTENKIDLFLIDLSLGLQKSGLILIKELRASEKYSNTPIIVVTAHAFSRDERVTLEAGANKFLRKPIESSKLMSEINSLIQNSKTRKTIVD